MFSVCVGLTLSRGGCQRRAKKYLERAKIWRKIGGGLHITLQAYRVYVMSVLTFVAQLVAPPPEWEQTERQA